MKTISVLMPTRNSIPMLITALVSILESCSNTNEVEILLRIDDDDKERVDLIPMLEKRFAAKCVVGTRGAGYNDMGRFIAELLAVADSEWVWLFDDDASVDGDWLGALKKIKCDPKNGPAVNAENYVLGGSHYKNGPVGGPVGLIVPTKFARNIPARSPVDQVWLDVLLRKGWTIKQLDDVTYFHDGRAR